MITFVVSGKEGPMSLFLSRC